MFPALPGSEQSLRGAKVRRIYASLQAQGSRFWIQAGLLAFVALLIVGIALNVAANIERQSLHFGLDFLRRPAGFSILQTLIPFNESSTFGRAFIVGLLNTLLVAVIGIAAATILGFAIGLARLAPNWLLRWAAVGYVELFRNLPLLLILFFLYFGLLRQLPAPKQSLELGGAFLNNRGLFLPSPDFARPASSLCDLSNIRGGGTLFERPHSGRWRHRRDDRLSMGREQPRS